MTQSVFIQIVSEFDIQSDIRTLTTSYWFHFGTMHMQIKRPAQDSGTASSWNSYASLSAVVMSCPIHISQHLVAPLAPFCCPYKGIARILESELTVYQNPITHSPEPFVVQLDLVQSWPHLGITASWSRCSRSSRWLQSLAKVGLTCLVVACHPP